MSLRSVSRRRRYRGSQRVWYSSCAMAQQMWMIGPSLPDERPEASASASASAFTRTTRHVRESTTTMPRSVSITSGSPEPAACGVILTSWHESSAKLAPETTHAE
eukprot:820270-Pleurochrysis_carterae.AAC.1